MARGGARPGAGRPKAAISKKTKAARAVANRALTADMTPLDVMLLAMNKALESQDYPAAADFAKDAAPYVHPRLAAIEHGGPDNGPIQFQQITRRIVRVNDTDA